jgi:hypothetical protein
MIYPAWVWTLKVAGADDDVHAFDGLMQGLAPRRGFKILSIKGNINVGDAAAVDASETYMTFLKNIAEGLHHEAPASDGDATQSEKAGVMYVDHQVYDTGDDSRSFQFTPAEPWDFDADDRFNINLTFNNKDAASEEAIFRLQAQVELK